VQTLCVDAITYLDSVDPASPRSKIRSGDEGVATVVARPDEEHDVRSGDLTALGFQQPQADIAETSGSALHDNLGRHRGEQCLFRGTHLRHGQERDHHSTVTDLAKLRG